MVRFLVFTQDLFFDDVQQLLDKGGRTTARECDDGYSNAVQPAVVFEVKTPEELGELYNFSKALFQVEGDDCDTELEYDSKEQEFILYLPWYYK